MGLIRRVMHLTRVKQMAILQASHNKEHGFDRPPLDLKGTSGNQHCNKRNNLATIHSLLDLVDFNAARNPDHVFCLQEVKQELELHKLTFKGLADAVEICTTWLGRELVGLASSERNGKAEKLAAVALLMGSDITLFIYILALMRLGLDRPNFCQVALFSARLSPSAIAHLIEKVKVKNVIISSHTSRSANEASSIVQKNGLDAVSLIQSAPFEFFVNGRQPSNGYLHRPTTTHEVDRNAIILHSSGSTGLPKPIYHAHEYLLNYATCHRFLPGEDTTSVCTSTLPLFHVSSCDRKLYKQSLILYVF
ncbi:MAG: hypothetical protein Q9195_008048 [Heterodermia aff. obscurata]